MRKVDPGPSSLNAHAITQLCSSRRQPGSVQYCRRINRGPSESTQISPRGHRANKNPLIKSQRLHSDAVAKNRSARKRARWINGNNTHSLATLAIEQRELIDQRRFSSSRGPRNTDNKAATGKRIDLLH